MEGLFYEDVPVFTFNVYVITHEMGHLLGSRHTHACVWNGNNTAIDGCSGFTEEGCPLPPSPPGGGTIMSYCHNDPVGIDFNLGFGPQPGNVIRNVVNNAPCVSDSDNDGLCGSDDPCPKDPDNDGDSDGFCADADNCPDTANPSQADADNDGIGDACDACPNDPDNDIDNDGVCGDVDNCPDTPNADQADSDNNGVGDACETGEVCINTAVNNLTDYVDGLNISSSRKRAVNSRLELAESKFCRYNAVSSAIATLEYVIDYVDSQRGRGIPAAAADHIIAEVDMLIDALEDDNAVCCSSNRPVNPGHVAAVGGLQLEANPNPFREEVSIRFYLPEAGPATLEVFNLNGQRMAALHSGYLDAGHQSFGWNGDGEDGRRLSGGVYLVRLQAVGGTLTQKVSLVR